MAIPGPLRRAFLRFSEGAVRPFFGGIGCIFCLHRVVGSPDDVSSIPDNRALELTESQLREVLGWTLGCGLLPVPIDELPGRLEKAGHRKFVCFTFDDGYSDNLRVALPIFREFGIPFAVFPATRFIGGTLPVWWYAFERAIGLQTAISFEWDGVRHAFELASPASRERAFSRLAGLVRGEGVARRDELVGTVLRAAGLDGWEATRRMVMGWDELAELARDPLVTVGGHTSGHHVLRNLSPEEVASEFSECRRELQERLGREIRHLAYPFGGRNAVGLREFEIARECGFATALTTRCGNLFPGHRGQPHALPRLFLSGNYAVGQLLPKMESGLSSIRENGFRRPIAD
jgi:peptidoglycan/xylan/chitin deacetylase (PgdA/CDA1 family)